MQKPQAQRDPVFLAAELKNMKPNRGERAKHRVEESLEMLRMEFLSDGGEEEGLWLR